MALYSEKQALFVKYAKDGYYYAAKVLKINKALGGYNYDVLFSDKVKQLDTKEVDILVSKDEANAFNSRLRTQPLAPPNPQ
jgi:hypothetical protein